MEVKYEIDQKGDFKSIVTCIVFRSEVADSWNSEETKSLIVDAFRQWKQSKAGLFIINKSVSPLSFHSRQNVSAVSVEIAVLATIEQKHFSEYLLRWGENGSNTS